MKILITVATYYPKKDGVSVVTQYLAEGLAKRGNEVKIVTSTRGGKRKKEIHNGVIIERVDLRTRFGLYFGDKNGYQTMIEKETDWADIMINVCTQTAFTDVILKRISDYNCKKILYMHGMFDFRLRTIHFSSFVGSVNKIWKEVRWFFYYKFKKKFFKQYDVVIQLHEKDYGNVFFEKNYGIKSIIIGNAADDIFFRRYGTKDFVKPFEKYLLYVANYDDGKNQKLAVKEFLKSDIDPEIGLVLIGSQENSYYKRLRKYANRRRKRLGLKGAEKPIIFLHGIERDKLVLYVTNAYLSLMTSKWEVFPVSIIESIVCGVPFISTDVGVVKHFPGGIVAKKQEIHVWIERLVRDQRRREELAALCRQCGENNFKIQNKVDLLERTIVELARNDKNGEQMKSDKT